MNEDLDKIVASLTEEQKQVLLDNNLLRLFKGRVRHTNHIALARGRSEQITIEEFVELCHAFEYRCAYCREDRLLGPDHMIPFSRGGSNHISNIIPSCLSCNSQKGCLTTEEYLRWLKDSKSIKR